MSKTNIQIVQEFIEAMNQRQFDHIFEYCSQDCIAHGSPYVGLGFVPDISSGVQYMIRSVIPGGPCEGHLQAGDELVRVTDTTHTWESFEQFKVGLWSRGVLGTSLTLTVRRAGALIEIPLVRGLVKPFAFKYAENINNLQEYYKEWLELKEEINLILASEDWVVVYSTITGTNQNYHRSAVWSGCAIFRLRNEKIIEMMGVEDEFSQMNQLGYQIIEPQRELMP